ncbi:hypothetical protein [Leptospira santarosai]|nr:hypothetical protein [Leptospira santarosai]MDI7188389.1 hypothetical protein [Leptospira santarosai]
MQRLNLELALTRNRKFQLRIPSATNGLNRVPLFIIREFMKNGEAVR